MESNPVDVGDLLQFDNPNPSTSISVAPEKDQEVDLTSPNTSLKTFEKDPFAIPVAVQVPQTVQNDLQLLSPQNSVGNIVELYEIQKGSEAVSVPPTPGIANVPVTISSISSNPDSFLATKTAAFQSQPASRLNPVPPYISPIHFELPTRKWTDSTSFYEIPFIDLLSEAISKTFSNQLPNQRPQRPIMSLEQALEFPDPYIPLIQYNSWRAVAQLARNDLICTHPTNVDEIMRLWSIRWKALLKLSLYDIIQAEMDKLKILELKELQFEKYLDIFPGRKGLMVHFDLLLIMSQIPSLKGNHHDSIHKTYRLLYPQKPWDFCPTKEQHQRLVLNIANYLVKLSDLSLAVSLLNSVIESEGDNIQLLTIKGRLELQQGDIKSAQESFEKIEKLLGIPANHTLPAIVPSPELVLGHRGLIAFGKDDYMEALRYFTELLRLLPDSPVAINNVAVAYLYSGNVGQAASYLENFILSHPHLGSLFPELLFNVSSMYDLTDSSLCKKKTLLKVIIPGCGDDFDPDCLKL